MEYSSVIDFIVIFIVVGVFVILVNKTWHKTVYQPINEYKLSSKLKLDRVIGDGSIILDKDGGCHRVIELSGHDFAALDEKDRERKLWDREDWIKQLSEENVKTKIISHKSLHRPQPLNEHTRPHLARADRKWEAQFKSSYELRHFIIFSVPSEGDLKTLEKAIDDTMDALSDYKPRILGLESDEYSSLLTFFSDLANPLDPMPVGDFREEISEIITGCYFRTRSNGVMEFERGPETVFGAGVGIFKWTNKLDDAMFADILAQDVPMTVLHMIEVMGQGKSSFEVSSRSSTRVDTAFAAVAEQFETAKQWTTQGGAEEFHGVMQHVSFIVYGHTKKELAENIRKIKRTFRPYGLRPKVEGPAIGAAYLSLFPGIRRPFREQFVFSHNMAAMATFEGKDQGFDRSAFGEGPVQRFRPVDGVGTVNYQFHKSDKPKEVGHTNLIGSTGRGKTTILSFFIKGLLRFKKVRIFAFDRRKGMYVFCKFAGGTYVSLENKQGFNPLQQELTAQNRQRIRHWLRMLGGGLNDPETDKLLGRIMRTLPNIPKEHRSLKTLWPTHLKGTEFGRRIEKWVNDPDFDWIFNAPECLLYKCMRENRLVVIDTKDFLDNPEIAPPFLLYSLSAVEEICTSDGVPFAFVCDEAAGALENDEFLPQVKEITQEWRKLGGIIVFGFQTDETIREKGLERRMREQMATQIFFRNDRLDVESAEKWGLTQNEIDFLSYKTGRKAGDYALLIKQPKLTTTIQANLSILGDDLEMFNSDSAAAKALIALEDDPSVADPLQAYLDLKGDYSKYANDNDDKENAA